MSTQSTAPASETFTDFVLWVIDQLQYPRSVEAGLHRVQIPEADQSAFGGQSEIAFRFSADASEAEILTPDSPLFETLLNQLRAAKSVICSQPREQVNRLHQIASRLFPAYSVLEGHIHLAGCYLEDRPFVRLTYRNGGAATAAGEEDNPSCPVIHRYFDAEGSLLTNQQVADLGLAELVRAIDGNAHLSPTEFERLISVAKEHIDSPPAEQAEANSSPGGPGELLAQTVIWCKYAEGKLAVSVGENSAEFPFAGWANLIHPEALPCPQTGEPTHAFAATHEGIIAAASQIARCTETGKRELKRDLIACSVSGKLALPDRMVTCPVSEEPVSRSVLIQCPVCHQEVSPDVLTRGICRACAAPPRVTKNDARLARVLGEYPRLDIWRRWKLSETATVYIAQASSMLKRLLLVLNKQTLEVQHMATGTSLTRRWQPVPAEQWEGYLRSHDDDEG